jgi:ABC-2 type transport system ATP-binding protein
VFDGLDPAARLVFKRGLSNLMTRTGGTAVLAGHSLRELEDVCDSYGLIDEKKISVSGLLSEASKNVFKFHIAFKNETPEEALGFKCLSYETSGKIVRIVVRGEKEELLNKLNALKPLVIDEAPVNFEEFFLSEIAEKGGKL